jgi:hypothetical protein
MMARGTTPDLPAETDDRERPRDRLRQREESDSAILLQSRRWDKDFMSPGANLAGDQRPSVEAEALFVRKSMRSGRLQREESHWRTLCIGRRNLHGRSPF